MLIVSYDTGSMMHISKTKLQKEAYKGFSLECNDFMNFLKER